MRERHYAVHLGSRQVQDVGDERYGFSVDPKLSCSACRMEPPV
jgi:hypothetical protein